MQLTNEELKKKLELLESSLYRAYHCYSQALTTEFCLSKVQVHSDYEVLFELQTYAKDALIIELANLTSRNVSSGGVSLQSLARSLEQNVSLCARFQHKHAHLSKGEQQGILNDQMARAIGQLISEDHVKYVKAIRDKIIAHRDMGHPFLDVALQELTIGRVATLLENSLAMVVFFRRLVEDTDVALFTITEFASRQVIERFLKIAARNSPEAGELHAALGQSNLDPEQGTWWPEGLDPATCPETQASIILKKFGLF